MGKGVDMIRGASPEHAAIIDDFKDQLLIAMVRKFGGKVTIPVKDVDDTGGFTLSFSVTDGNFNFVLGRKQ